ncbi:integral peroxisomal membrane peroxin-domain-containing protein [Dichomitus squalens]|nr:integral peroxisomal membrane peroxin-domain-containing protein [Dichomitus squalens]
MSRTADETTHAQSTPLVEFLNTLPSPVTTALVGLAPVISRSRYLAQLLVWKAAWEDCWLFLASWWAICLVPELGLRYLLPLAVLLVYFRPRGDPNIQRSPPTITEDTLQRAITDLTTIHALLPSLPLPVPSKPLTVPKPLVLLRSIAVLYIPYFALTYVVRIRILLALFGTLFLTWRARWAVVLRGALWRSAHIRWAVYRLWSFLSGQSLPPLTRSPQAQSEARLASVSSPSSLQAQKKPLPDTNVRFLFTIYENQRWWMGLDWTAALLPGERPSWCSASQQPAAPPSAFTLPAPTTAYTPTADGKGRVKRVARWRWEEDEWRVVVRREGSGTSRVERPVPSAKEESAAAASANRILKAAGKMRSGSLDLMEKGTEKERDAQANSGEGHGYSGEHGTSPNDSAHDAKDEVEVEEPFTDADGWVYADNKWEGASSKGGMGKYTRYRRWTRIAVLTETVEVVGPGELGIRRDELPAPALEASAPSLVIPSLSQTVAAGPRTPLKEPADNSNNTASRPGHSRSSSSTASWPPAEAISRETVTVTPASSPAVDDSASRLRQRLKAAVLGTGDHS